VTVIATVIDPEGRRVELTAERWRHILFRHPQLKPYMEDVLKAIQAPTVRQADPTPDTQRFFLKDVGPEPWLRVVVAFRVDRAFVITAFGQQTEP
jgi:hypothetical protein